MTNIRKWVNTTVLVLKLTPFRYEYIYSQGTESCGDVKNRHVFSPVTRQ